MHVFLKALLRKSHHTEKDLFSLHPWHHKHPHPAKVHGGTLEPGSWNWIQPTFAAASRNRAKIKKTATKFPLTWKWFFFAPLIICRKGEVTPSAFRVQSCRIVYPELIYMAIITYVSETYMSKKYSIFSGEIICQEIFSPEIFCPEIVLSKIFRQEIHIHSFAKFSLSCFNLSFYWLGPPFSQYPNPRIPDSYSSCCCSSSSITK